MIHIDMFTNSPVSSRGSPCPTVGEWSQGPDEDGTIHTIHGNIKKRLGRNESGCYTSPSAAAPVVYAAADA